MTSFLVLVAVVLAVIPASHAFEELQAAGAAQQTRRALLHALDRYSGVPLLSSSEQPHHHRRMLAALNYTQCVWDGAKCSLNQVYIGTFPAPTTDGGKATAASQAKGYICAGYTNQASCTSTASDSCGWVTTSGTPYCALSTAFKTGLMRGFVYCAGSRMDQAVSCAMYADNATCAADSACTFVAGTSFGSYSAMAELVTVTATQYAGASATKNSTALRCYPKWLSNNTAIGSILTAALAAANGSVINALFIPELMGNCTSINKYKTAILGCWPKANNRTGCLSNPVCAWTPQYLGISIGNSSASDSTLGECGPSETSFMDLLFSEADPFLTAYDNATAVCSSKTSSSACTGTGSAMVDVASLTAYKDIQLSYKSGSAGIVRVPLLMSLLMAVLCLLAFGRT